MEHLHQRTDEFVIYWIPSDTDVPAQIKVIESDWRSMSNFLDGGYMEVVKGLQMVPTLECGCEVVMVMDEDGLIKKLDDNLRATALIPDTVHMSDNIVGDVFLIGLGPVKPLDPEDDVFNDFVTLPPIMAEWGGPGAPLPTLS